MKTIHVGVAVMAAVMTACAAQAQVAIGSAAPDFELQDTKGQAHSLKQYEGKIVILEWINHDCPFVKKHYNTGNMQTLQKEMTDKGIVWLSICSSAPGKQGYFDAATWESLTAEKKAAALAVLLDPDGTVGRAYAAKTKPHCFVIDANGTVVYQGAIDDKPSFDPATVEGAKNHVRAAVDALLEGHEIETTETQAYGCSVKY